MNLNEFGAVEGNERLIIDRIDFAIDKQIEQAAPEMMIRELVQNGIESVLMDESDNPRKIIISKEKVNGHSKLCIYNTGIGMNAEEIYKMGDLSTVINKKLGFDDNYGEGAKVSSLLYNPVGMVYDSCKDGFVSKIWLNKEKTYGRRPFDNPRALLHISKSVLDVTDLYKETERENDWTKVVLLGKSYEQDTSINPYGNGSLRESWIAEYLYHRFYRIDPSIEIILQGVGHKSKEKTAIFETIEQRRNKDVFSRSETIELSNGIKLHFIHDEMVGTKQRISSSRGGLQTDVTFGGIVYKNEIYNLVKGSNWTNKCFTFGLTYAGSVVSILIELPDDGKVMPNQYRNGLKDKNNDRKDINLEDYSSIVSANIPSWVKKIIDDNSPTNTSSFDDLDKHFSDLMTNLTLKKEVVGIYNDDGDADFGESNVDGARIIKSSSPRKFSIVTPEDVEELGEEVVSKKKKPLYVVDGKKASSPVQRPHKLLNLHPLTSEQDILEKEIVNKAARYVRETNDLFINMNYPVVERMFQSLIIHYPNVDRLLFDARANEMIAKRMIQRIGETVIKALAKQQNSKWTREEVDKALTTETLSMAAENDEYHYQVIKSRLSAEFLSNKNSSVKENVGIV